MSDTSNSTCAANSTQAETEATSNDKQAVNDNVISRRDYDTIAGKYGSALQRIKQLEESLLEVDKIKVALKEKEKQIEQLSVYRDKHNAAIISQWQSIKSQITDEFKEFFNNPDTTDIGEIEQYIEKWQEIEKIKSTLSKNQNVKPVPPIAKNTTGTNKTIVHNVPTNWRIG